jgi:hypothetical protein
MARMTFRDMIADIQRKPGLESMSLGEIMDSISSVSKDLGNQPWPWNYAETNVLVPAPYSTGTVNVTDQTSAVVGVATNWAPFVGLPGWRLRFGSSNLDYIITSINNAASITLAQPINLGANIVNGSYTLYKDTYQYPTDYVVASDVALLQPIIRTRIPKVPRYKFEIVMNAGLRSFSTNIQMFYCDHEETAAGVYQFRLGPPPAGPSELRLCYHKQSPDVVITNPAQVTMLPDGYDEIISLGAAAKLYMLHKQPGLADQINAITAGKIKLLKRQVAAQTIDDIPNAAYEVPDSSISQWGMIIGGHVP